MNGKILVTGGGGLIGAYLRSLGGSRIVCIDRAELDISDLSEFESILSGNDISWVVNCAGSAHGNDRELFAINAFCPMDMAKICSKLNVGFAFLSTARVFGVGEGPFAEDVVPCPYDSYGLSKYVGEQLVTRELSAGRYYIFRVGMVLGNVSGRNADKQIVTRLVDKGRRGQNVRAAADSWTSVVHAGCVAERILMCIDSCLPNGIYHISGADCISIFDLINTVFERLSLPGRVERASSREFSSSLPIPPSAQALKSLMISDCGDCLQAIEKYCSEQGR
ncbi:sugar nucleotide-binding protein [Maridesulfovibrio sp.]|uniref:SDR family oxidoreductase n=1 Tax=Maridesulfovibrio sp. TaxID=2795000 RepID=UPI002A18C614|nr:sugar nucleotide-binding protein [Maridesulfovibrio sp.]